jgi:Reverse transcriptase (RNA-dependent DNA polymerase)
MFIDSGADVNTLSENDWLSAVPNELVHFDVDESVAPTKDAYYPVPTAFRAQARDRLNEMLSQGIIGKVTKAPRWISGLSLVPKGKTDFHLVINMRGANIAIRRSFHPLPTVDDMRIELAEATVFSKLDIKSAFHHLELDEESRELTTFRTESEMKRFTRLMFGVNCAPEIFQRTMERILSGLVGVIILIATSGC